MLENLIQQGYPDDYPRFKIGHIVGLITSPDKLTSFFRVKNVERIQPLDQQASAWNTLAAAATNSIGTVSDWLETGSDVLYALLLGVWSHPDVIDVSVNMPKATELYGIKSSITGRVNAINSPVNNPSVPIYSYGRDFIPSFTLRNGTSTAFTSTVGHVKIVVVGFKYKLEPIAEQPARAHVINLLPVEDI